MSRKKHKNNPKDTLAVLETLQEARKATQQIKAELLEHNEVIKLHSDDAQTALYSNNTHAETDPVVTNSTNDNAVKGDSQNYGHSAGNDRKFDHMQDSIKNESASKLLEEAAAQVSPVTIPNILEPWLAMQFQIARGMSEAWLNMFKKDKTDSQEA